MNSMRPWCAVLVLILIMWSSTPAQSPPVQGAAKQDKPAAAKPPVRMLRVPQTEDFEVTGDGSASGWKKANWEALNKRKPDGHPYDARVKMLYSKTGIYVLFDGTDEKLTATLKEDFQNLWTEDVYEVFLWPDERQPIYFEYEISPLNRELPILVPNFDGKFLVKVPERGKNPFGRPIFQNLQYSDTPTQPLVQMRHTDTKVEPGKKHTYRIIAVNTVKLKSMPSADAVTATAR